VANAGRLQVERRQEDLVVRRLERVARVADAATAPHRSDTAHPAA
jgi:hypothetical protein